MLSFVIHQIGSALFLIGPLLFVWEYQKWRSQKSQKRFVIMGVFCIGLTVLGMISLRENLKQQELDLPSQSAKLEVF